MTTSAALPDSILYRRMLSGRLEFYDQASRSFWRQGRTGKTRRVDVCPLKRTDWQKMRLRSGAVLEAWMARPELQR